ncbi:MAG: glycogen synthase [Leptospirales bacterium]
MKTSGKQKSSPPFKVLYLSSEIVPFLKSGGLADVSGSLPIALKLAALNGIEIRVVTTAFKGIREHQSIQLHRSFLFSTPSGKRKADIFQVWTGSGTGRVPVYFIGIDDLFERNGLYGENETEYPDNFERYLLWSYAIREFIRSESYTPDIVHGNDWQTGLFFPLLQIWQDEDTELAGTHSLFTIHNLAYKGLFPLNRLPETGLPKRYGHFSRLEFYGQLSFLKGGICCTDVVTTVSPGYRNEVLKEPDGEGLSGALGARGPHFVGVLNGMDTERWNPETDPLLKTPFSATDHLRKNLAKHDLIKRFGIDDARDLPLIGMVTRMTGQKGIDLAFEAIESLYRNNEPFRMVVLGSGSPVLEKKAKELASTYNGAFGLKLGFDDDLARRIYAGSDFFLMPSRFEPCGLSQMYAMRYGSIPIVNPTGGLKDTVPPGKTGLWLETLSVGGITQGILEALRLYNDKVAFDQFRTNAMREENGWGKRAEEYLGLYEEGSGKKILKITGPL